ncbi:hypothetical protein K492DRAFT_131214 [Lichtheimia hyalospora FSU 10163]|nr:hypothetical protein K492DRAFT_131214 [Lichtheimia hyalospora FSU 10163]
MSITIVLTFMVDAGIFTARAILNKHWTSTVLAYYIGVSWMAWILGLMAMTHEAHNFGRWSWVQYIFWMTATLGESLIAWLWFVAFFSPRTGTVFDKYDFLFLGTFAMRYGLEVCTMVLCLIQMFIREPSSGEWSPLVSTQAASSSYGTEAFQKGQQPTTITATSNHSSLSKLGALLSYTWPRGSLWLQLLMFLCFLLMWVGLAVNAMMPLAMGMLVDSLGHTKWAFVCILILVYMGLRFLRGKSGFIQCTQNWLWIPVGQHITKTMSLNTLERLYDLSLAFDPIRKSEALKVFDHAIPSIAPMLPQLLFQVVPAVIDVIVAVILLWFLYSPSAGLIVLITMSLYILVTISLSGNVIPASLSNKRYRYMLERNNETRIKAINSILNYETVKYNNAERIELERYRTAMIDWEKADYRYSSSRVITRLVQHTVIASGFLAGCLLFAWEVSQARCTPGDFVLFNFYMLGLCEPLSDFDAHYRSMQASWIELDKVLGLLKKKPRRGEKNVVINKGSIVFDNVRFSYDNRHAALKGVSFSVQASTKVALVGQRGAGKSTISRLLYRFYDSDSGTIYIDGHDVKSATLKSIRQQIGVVPKDIVLFNESVYYNIAYGNWEASEDAVFRAAKFAQIHNTILKYPDAYETKLGSSGFQLTHSEKKRIAIARALLKDPAIVIVEDGSDAVDSSSDHQLHHALSTLTEGRTTLIIANQLSKCVTDADMIFFMRDGRIVESGTHESLTIPEIGYHRQGTYYDMWKSQCLDEEQRYKPSKENIMNEAVLSTSPNMIPSDIPPPSIDNTRSRRKPETSLDEPTALPPSMIVKETASEDQKVTQENDSNVVKAEGNSKNTIEYPNTTTTNNNSNNNNESQKETKTENNGSSKKKKKNKPKKRKNSTVF